MPLYLDSSVIIYAVESTAPFRDAVVARIAEAERTGQLVTSQLARLECRVKPLRENDTGLLQRFDDFFAHPSLDVVEISAAVVDGATALRAHDAFRTPDALHLATAIEYGADVFLTGDQRLARCDRVRIEVVRA